MRIKVDGDGPCARAVRGNLVKAGYAVVGVFEQYRVVITEADVDTIEFDSIDCQLEQLAKRFVTWRSDEHGGRGRIAIQKSGGNQSDRELHITVPRANAVEQEAVEVGVMRAFLALTGDPRGRRWWQLWAGLTVAVLLPTMASAQGVRAVGGSASSGTVAQGTPTAKTDAAAWPIEIIFGSAQIDPRDVSDRMARSLGHIVCDSGCGSPPATPDNAAFTASTTNVTITAGVYNDALTGLSSGVSAGFRITARRGLHTNLRDSSGNELGISGTPLYVTGAGGTFPVTGTFWQITQPVSIASMPSTPVTGPLTDTQLRATAVPVSGTVTTTPPSNASTNIAQIGGATLTIGQQLAAASVPVVLPSATVSTLTPPAAITGYALEAGHVATIDTSTARIPAQGQALSGASMPVVLPVAQITALTPPTTVAVTSAGLSNLDVALSTRTKPADQQHTIIDSSATLAVSNTQLPVALGTNLGLKVEPTDQTASVTVSAANAACLGTNCVSLALQGEALVAVTAQGAMSATLVFESSVDGTTLAFHSCYTTALASTTGTTNAGTWFCPVAGYNKFQVRASVYTSGSPVVTLRATVAPNLSTVFLPAATVTALTPPTTVAVTSAGLTNLDIATSALRDAITAASPNNKTLNDLYTQLAAVISAIGEARTLILSTTAPAKVDVVAGITSDVTPQYQPLPLQRGGGAVVVAAQALPLPPSQRCNPLRRTNCVP